MNLHVAEAQDADTLVLVLRGELDVYTSPYLKQQIVDRLADAKYEGMGFAVDLQGLEHFDACGMGVLIGALKRCRERGREFSLRGANERIRRYFQTTGVNTIIPNSWTPAKH